jgi:hypothetical protein
MRQSFDKYTLLMRTEAQRDKLRRIAERIPLDPEKPLRIVIDDPLPDKSREQEQKYHSMIGDISRQFQHCGKKWSADDMKRLLVDQFRRDTIFDSDIRPLWDSMGVIEMAPSLDGSGTVILGVQTRKFPMKLASIFIEWLLAFGAEINVQWSNET